MSHPLIGITAGHSLNKHGLPIIHLLRTYVDATLVAGGVPVIIPSELAEGNWKLLYEKLDGVIFSGGADIDPERFGGETHPTVSGVDAERDKLEINLMQHMLDDDKPIFAICRGMQLLNVAAGGTLYTDIADQVGEEIKHDTSYDMPRNSLVHEVRVEEETLLAEILGTPILKVNSWHHQALKDIPPQFKITAYSPDGLVEGMELPDHPFALAVQWHPEWIQEHQPMRNLFSAFVDASRLNGKG
ncbi:MAG: gamma-glutamyl-gamma-aminobutyrate hydrolase family protein [Anaerolineae bacterium]|jgi:putative glutamine amidotransferase|nr:gamma-glutamyl-gamma-aminobutyrate hydrolase family protein [Anaerolineae bacterium]MBT7070223.1 gamma-glutamyl-gamma-aminobutyrate hydrolase family protein [Anaerolineae bacterium]MBT7324954.1 gamma-glutamyl-gamma-aminobutyrate hydrolase family protein [Anaerolineae bacterium]